VTRERALAEYERLGGLTYENRVTATLTTTGGRVKEAEIDIKVKEV